MIENDYISWLEGELYRQRMCCAYVWTFHICL
jgi:hypothetical protein